MLKSDVVERDAWKLKGLAPLVSHRMPLHDLAAYHRSAAPPMNSPLPHSRSGLSSHLRLFTSPSPNSRLKRMRPVNQDAVESRKGLYIVCRQSWGRTAWLQPAAPSFLQSSASAECVDERDLRNLWLIAFPFPICPCHPSPPFPSIASSL